VDTVIVEHWTSAEQFIHARSRTGRLVACACQAAQPVSAR
jgi:hypothetical protein